MSVTATPIYPQSIVNDVLAIVNATGTTVTTLVTAGSNGTKIESLNLSNTDAGSAYVVQLFVVVSSTNYLIGTVNVPLSSGNTVAAPAVSALTRANIPALAIDANGNPYLYLASGSSLALAVTVAITSGKTVAALAQGGNY